MRGSNGAARHWQRVDGAQLAVSAAAMILGALTSENPFGLACLHWREGRFAVSEARSLTHLGDLLGPVTVALADSIQNAVAKRRSEFLAGRACAALALREAGMPEIIGLQDRAPIWPAGCVGSISHSDSRVVAVVSRNHSGVGVDIEPLMTTEQARDIQDLILTESEGRLRPHTMDAATFLTLVFSAKESVYKALSSRLSKMPTFLDVTLLDFSSNGLALRLGNDAHRIRYQLSLTEVMTLVLIDT